MSLKINESKLHFAKCVSKINNEKVYILPEVNIDYELTNIFYEETVDFYKYIRTHENNMDFELFKIEEDINMRVIHSNEIILPTLYFFTSQIAIPMLTMVAYDYVKFKIGKWNNQHKTVKFKAIAENEDGRQKVIEYDGPAEKFKETFEKIDLNKMFKD